MRHERRSDALREAPRRAQRRVTNGEDGVRSHRPVDARKARRQIAAERARGRAAPTV